MKNRFRRLISVRSELEAIRESIAYVYKNWDKHDFDRSLQSHRRDLYLATNNLEATYFLRLFAEFEEALKEHLVLRHPNIKLMRNANVDWLISANLKANKLKVDTILLGDIDAVRKYRNEIAHRGLPLDTAIVTVTFADALATLNTFLAKLSD